ncbi:DUF916 and DUF3324 domain-containing protein [Enterococcus faecium]|nr:DUF916 and DUF3324 domain-containing protein [Enterococcus faecium]
MFLSIMLVNILFVNKVYAEEGIFSVSPLTEEGSFLQKGYYHFVGLPSDKKSVSLELKNGTDKEIDVEAEINTAWTNQNGIPSYTANDKKDSTLSYSMEDLAEIEESSIITLPAHGEKIIPVTISYPKTKWKGQLLGGLRLHAINGKEERKGVENEVAYTVGILLEMENAENTDYHFQMNDVKVDQRNYRNFIEVNLQNMAPKIVKNMEVKTYVYKDKQTKPMYELQSDSFRMAPNSNFDIGIPTGEVPISAGNYHVLLKVKVDGQVYEFSKNFVIEQKTANQLNKTAVNITTKDHTVRYVIISIIGLLVILYIIKLLILKRRPSKM